MLKKLFQLNKMFLGNWDAIYEGVRQKVLVGNKKIPANFDFEEETKDINLVSMLSDNYPSCFKNINKSPFVIFYEGNISLTNDKEYIGLIGDVKVSDLDGIPFSNQQCLVISSFDLNKNVETFLINSKINHIVIFNEKINRKSKGDNQLLISEFNTDVVLYSDGQTTERFITGSAKDVFVFFSKKSDREFSPGKDLETNYYFVVSEMSKEKIDILQQVKNELHLDQINLIENMKSKFNLKN